MIELRHLRYFVAVADELHFGRAASRLGISQPPLSQQVRALEDELGSVLLERTSRRVRLTDAGCIFLTEARLTLAQADRAIDAVGRLRRGEAGELAIGFVSSVPFVTKVAGALFRYRQAYPEVQLRLAELPRDDQLAMIAAGELDVGFVRGMEKPRLAGPLIAAPFLEEELIVAMRRDHPLARTDEPLRVADLAGEPMVRYEHRLGAGFNEEFDLLCRRAGFEPLVAQEVAGLATLLGLVTAGFGLTVLARSLGALHLDDLAYRPLVEPGAISRLWLVHQQEKSPACARFIALTCGSEHYDDGTRACNP